MTFLTKFPRTKLFAVLASFVATATVWGALAWPDWTSAKANKSYVVPDPQIIALQALAALPPDQLAALTEPTAAPQPAPRQVIRQTVVIKRTVPGPTYAIPVDEPPASGVEQPAALVAGNGAPAAEQPAASNPSPGRGAPPPAPAPQPGDPPAAVVPAQPKPSAPSAPPPPAPVPTTPPPPPPPTPKPAPPAPAPTQTKAS